MFDEILQSDQDECSETIYNISYKYNRSRNVQTSLWRVMAMCTVMH